MNLFDKTLKKLVKVNTTATYRSMNKALAKTNTKYRRELSKSTGIKTSELNRRLFQKKANSKNLTVSLTTGVKFGLPLELFKPRVKVVKKNKRKYNGVTAKLPEQSRQLVQGAFFMTTKSGGLIVVKRKSGRKLPVEKIKVNIAQQASALRASNQSFLKDEFKSEFSRQVSYLLDK